MPEPIKNGNLQQVMTRMIAQKLDAKDGKVDGKISGTLFDSTANAMGLKTNVYGADISIADAMQALNQIDNSSEKPKSSNSTTDIVKSMVTKEDFQNGEVEKILQEMGLSKVEQQRTLAELKELLGFFNPGDVIPDGDKYL